MVLMKQKNEKETKWYIVENGEQLQISDLEMKKIYSWVTVDYKTDEIEINGYKCVNIFCHPCNWYESELTNFLIGKGVIKDV